VQYWEEFEKPTIPETIRSLLNFTKGGLFVYGSVIAGLPVGYWYLRKRGLPILAFGDIIAPSMVVGLALGRIGCFLTGLPDHTHGMHSSLPWAVHFGDGRNGGGIVAGRQGSARRRSMA